MIDHKNLHMAVLLNVHGLAAGEKSHSKAYPERL
jgi:hypothetical protein